LLRAPFAGPRRSALVTGSLSCRVLFRSLRPDERCLPFMRARFLFASAVLGGTVCSSCFIPGFTVGSDSASSGGTSTGGRASGGDGSAGEGGSAAHTGGAGGAPSCETIEPSAGLTLRAVQGASPYEFELPASVVASASQSSRGFAVSL